MSTETLEKFFTGKQFVIPAYQRDYAWVRANIDDLYSDIEEAIETSSHHYLGAFILSKQDYDERYKVVDGQQRLTTITMLLKALVDKLEDGERKLVDTYLFIGGADVSPFSVASDFRVRG